MADLKNDKAKIGLEVKKIESLELADEPLNKIIGEQSIGIESVGSKSEDSQIIYKEHPDDIQSTRDL